MRAISRILTLAVWVLLFTSQLLAAVTVQGIGRAPGNEPNCREVALGEALRDAVRRGAGVEVAAVSRVTDYTLDFDQILTRSMGVVRAYRVTQSGYDEFGDYVVNVSAEIEPGSPELDDAGAVRAIIRMKGSPRLAVEAEERVNGQLSPRPATAGVLAEYALNLGFQVVENSNATSGQNADIILRGNMEVDVSNPKNAYGVEIRDAMLSLELSAKRPGTGEILVTLAPPSFKSSSGAANPAGAAADSLRRLLHEGEVDRFFSRLLARWTLELDLGSLSRIHLQGFDLAETERIVAELRTSTGVTGVFLRSWAPNDGAFLDLESRLDSAVLGARLEHISAGKLTSLGDGTLVLNSNSVTQLKLSSSYIAGFLLLLAGGIALVAGIICLRRRSSSSV